MSMMKATQRDQPAATQTIASQAISGDAATPIGCATGAAVRSTGGLLVHGLRPGEPPEGELDGDIGIGWNEAGAQDGIAAGRGNQDRRHNTEHEPLNILVFPWAEGD